MKRIELIKIFKTYGEIGGCFLMTNIKTGESKGNGIVEIKKDEVYEILLNKKNIKLSDEVILEVSKWKNKCKLVKPMFHSNSNNVCDSICEIIGSQTKNKYDTKYNTDPQEIYRMAFKAGLHVGRLEGMKKTHN